MTFDEKPSTMEKEKDKEKDKERSKKDKKSGKKGTTPTNSASVNSIQTCNESFSTMNKCAALADIVELVDSLSFRRLFGVVFVAAPLLERRDRILFTRSIINNRRRKKEEKWRALE